MTDTDGQSSSARKMVLSRLLLVLILSLSAVIQLTVVYRTTVEGPLRSDAGNYLSYAYNLTHYGVYSISPTWIQGSTAKSPTPDAFRPPGYPLFLALVGKPEPSLSYLRRVSLAQAALAVVSVWLIYLISVRFLGRFWSLAVALITALSPHLATSTTYLLTESLFFFLLLGSILSLLKALESRNRLAFVLTGTLWGLCSLVRPTAEFFPPLLFLVVLAQPRLRQFRFFAVLAFACFIAVLAPWMIRNQADSVSKPESSLMVRTLAHGSYPGFMYEDKPESYGFPYRYDPRSEEIARDIPSILKHIAGRFSAQPVKYAQWYLIGKPGFFLSWGNVQGSDILIYPVLHTPYYEDIRFGVIWLVTYILHWPLMLLGLIGAAGLWLRPQWLGFSHSATQAAKITALVVAYAIAFHMIVAPFPRYGIPFRPLLYALALLPLRAAWLHRRRPRVVRLP